FPVGYMDAGVQGEPTIDALRACNPSRNNYRDLEGEETAEQRLERQKNALLTMISVRELKALLGETEGGRSPSIADKEERLPPKRIHPRGVKRNLIRGQGGGSTAKRRNPVIKTEPPQLGPERVTTFCFEKLEIGDFKLTAPDERCLVVPGTNWVKVDADQRILIYQFIVARSNSQTPYNVTVHVPFSSIAAIFCGFPEIIIKLNQPALLASCYQTFESSYQLVNDVDVTDGQLSRADVHKMALRRLSSGSSFQDVLLSADLTLFSSILTNGNHLSASSSLYSNYVYNHPHALLSDYGPSLQQSSYLGGMPPISINSSVLPHLTYSASLIHMGAGGVQLQERQGERTQVHPMQPELSPLNEGDADEFNEMFKKGVMGVHTQDGGESKKEGSKGLPALSLTPVSVHSTYVSPLMNAPFTARPMSSSDIVPRCTSSSLYALSGSPIFPPSITPTSSHSLHPPPIPPYSISNLPSSSSSRLPSSYPFTSSSLMTPSPLLPLSPFFSFSSLNTPTSVASSAFWNATMNSLRTEDFDTQRKDSLDLEMIPKDETKDEMDAMTEPMIEGDLMIDLDGEDDDDERSKFAPSEFSFSALCNYEEQ
ncbi:hypothetical protein PMAYCL1PPCAC_12651, partial [Pristionchus mayeri]